MAPRFVLTASQEELAAKPDPRDGRLRAERGASIHDLYDYLHKVVKVVRPDILFMPAYPAYIRRGALVEEQFTDTITYLTRRAEPGTVRNHPFDGPKEIKPRVREAAVPDENNPGYYYDEMGQWFDNLVLFEMWSLTNTGAVALEKWFKEFMFATTGIFMQYGIQQMYFYRKLEDDTLLDYDHRLQKRSFVYYVRTEEIWREEGKLIEQIRAAIEVSDEIV